MSLSLLGLLTEVMTMIGMEHLNFTGTGYSISFARSSVCLDLSHFFCILSISEVLLHGCFCVHIPHDLPDFRKSPLYTAFP